MIFFDQFSQDDEVHIGVFESRADWGRQFQLADFNPSLLGALEVVCHWIVGDQSAGVQQQVFDMDRVLVVRSKLWEKARYLILESEFPFLDQLQNRGGGGYRLGDRSHIEDRVECHGADRIEGAISECLLVDQSAAIADPDDASGHLAFRDCSLDHATYFRFKGL